MRQFDEMEAARTMHVRISVLAALLITVCGCGNADGPAGSRGANTSADAQHQLQTNQVVVRVGVFDDTEKNPLHDKAEIWLRGHGSWWIKPEAEFGGTTKTLGRRKVGQEDNIYIYPDGRDGREVAVPFLMTSEMNPGGSVRDSIIITISDDEVVVVGLPIKAATGQAELRFNRGS